MKRIFLVRRKMKS